MVCSCNITGRAMDACAVIVHVVYACWVAGYHLKISTYSYSAFKVFAAIRTYAIWGKNLRVLFCILVPGLIYPAGFIVGIIFNPGSVNALTNSVKQYYSVQGVYVASLPSPLTGCVIDYTFPEYLTPAIGADNLLWVKSISILLKIYARLSDIEKTAVSHSHVR